MENCFWQFVSRQQLASSSEPEEMCNNTLLGLMGEQVQHLLSLIEPTKSCYEKLEGKLFWIIDSGAFRNMTVELQNLEHKIVVTL